MFPSLHHDEYKQVSSSSLVPEKLPGTLFVYSFSILVPADYTCLSLVLLLCIAALSYYGGPIVNRTKYCLEK